MYECPKCGADFEAKEWVEGETPCCQVPYSWDERCSEDWSDCWAYLEFDEE